MKHQITYMRRNEVTAGDYVVTSADSESPIAIVQRLGAEIAITLYDPTTKRAALGLSLTTASLHRLFNEFPGYRERDSVDTVLAVRLVGGNDSKQSRETVLKLLEDLNAIDNGKNIINIVSADILEKPHPNAFCIDARNGMLSPLEIKDAGVSE